MMTTYNNHIEDVKCFGSGCKPEPAEEIKYPFHSVLSTQHLSYRQNAKMKDLTTKNSLSPQSSALF
jgi:hypothetical protein